MNFIEIERKYPSSCDLKEKNGPRQSGVVEHDMGSPN